MGGKKWDTRALLLLSIAPQRQPVNWQARAGESKATTSQFQGGHGPNKSGIAFFRPIEFPFTDVRRTHCWGGGSLSLSDPLKPSRKGPRAFFEKEPPHFPKRINGKRCAFWTVPPKKDPNWATKQSKELARLRDASQMRMW